MFIGPYTFNKIEYDEFGRASGVIGVNKPRGITSHDVVNEMRKKYFTKKVGHAGTLDPFAEGLLIILIGKALPFADQLLGLDKTYEATAMMGIETDSGDIEGKVTDVSHEVWGLGNLKSQASNLTPFLSKFIPSYSQQVPIFSSVKVAGQKLRVLARENDRFNIYEENGIKKVDFIKNEKITKTLEIPQREVKIYELRAMSDGQIPMQQILEDPMVSESIKEVLSSQFSALSDLQVPSTQFLVSCSKGTYIRQLITDIGRAADIPMTLYGLKRTRIGELNLDDSPVM